MNRFLITSFFALALMIGATGAAPVAHAATPEETCAAKIPDTSSTAYLQCIADATNPAPEYDAGAIQTSNDAAMQSAQSAAAKSQIDLKASEDAGYNSIMIKIMSLFAWLAGVAMITLNYATYYTVVAMGNFVSNISAIGVTWRILRDIGNIMLIFGFLAIGISVILNVNWYGGKTKMLPMLLVGAIFLNFSLFFTEAIIDTGNLFATQFYKQINGGVMPTVATLGDQGISAKIMSQLGLQTIYGDVQNAETAKKIFNSGSPWIIGFMGILLFIILAFVLFSLAFILIARFVILIFLIILAPIGFAGLAIPKLAGMAQRWWDTLFEQTVTAPVLMLLLYVALNVITDAQFLTGLGNGGRANWLGSVDGTVNGIASFAPVLISFLVAMGLLLAVTISAKKLSAFGADTVSKIGNSAKNSATKFAMSPVRYVGRTAKDVGKWTVHSTAGRGLYAAGQAIRTSGVGQTQFGRVVAQTLDKGGKGFKDSKDKSVKMHEEYVKSVQGAIEEKHMPAVVDLKLQKDAKQTKVDDIKSTYTEEDLADVKTKRSEVKRLKEIVNDNTARGVTGFAAVGAQSQLMMAEKDLKDKHGDLGEAEADLVKADEEEKEMTKAVTAAKKKAAIGYAQSIPKNPFVVGAGLPWLASGKGGNLASMKIIKDALNKESDSDKVIKHLKASMKKDDEDEAKKAGGAGAAPATPTPAPAPAPAGGGKP